MPAASDMTYPITVAKKTDDAHTVTIVPDGTETIDGAASHVLTVQSESVSVASDNANLYTLGNFASATTEVEGKTRYATATETKKCSEDSAAVTPSGLAAILGTFGAAHYGLLLSNNSSDASHDIDISAGACLDSTSASFLVLPSGLTKQIDAAWSEGTDAGGFPSGLTLETSIEDRANSTAYRLGDLVRANYSPWWWECTKAGTSGSSQPSGYAAASATVTDGTAVFTRTSPEWYRVFIISSSDLSLIDAGFDSDASATNLLSDASSYSLYRQIGWVLNDGAGNIVNFYADECGRFVWDTIQHCRAVSVDLSPSAVETMIVSPPDTVASLNVTMDIPGTADSNRFGLLTETRQTDTAASDTAYTLRMRAHTYGPQQENIEVELKVDSDSKIRTRGSDGDIGCGILCKGYKYLWD